MTSFPSPEIKLKNDSFTAANFLLAANASSLAAAAAANFLLATNASSLAAAAAALLAATFALRSSSAAASSFFLTSFPSPEIKLQNDSLDTFFPLFLEFSGSSTLRLSLSKTISGGSVYFFALRSFSATAASFVPTILFP